MTKKEFYQLVDQIIEAEPGTIKGNELLASKPLRFQEPGQVSQKLRRNLETAFALAMGFRQGGVCVPKSSVVFISSVAGFLGIPGKSAYAACRAGITSMAASFATGVAREGIRVNGVARGWVETEMTQSDAKTFTAEQHEALRRRHLLGVGHPRDVASAVAFLLADNGKWITGTVLIADGGSTAQNEKVGASLFLKEDVKRTVVGFGGSAVLQSLSVSRASGNNPGRGAIRQAARGQDGGQVDRACRKSPSANLVHLRARPARRRAGWRRGFSAAIDGENCDHPRRRAAGLCLAHSRSGRPRRSFDPKPERNCVPHRGLAKDSPLPPTGNHPARERVTIEHP